MKRFLAGVFLFVQSCIGLAQEGTQKDPILYPRWVDLSPDSSRQVVIARGTDSVYQGHPTTVLLPDNKTMYSVWTYGHGGHLGPMKKSNDGGLTWSPLLVTPASWTSVYNCPTIYRLVDPNGKARLFVFGGRGKDGKMHQSRSEDEGKTWTPMESNGLLCIMPFCTIVPVENGKKLLAQTNARDTFSKDEQSNVIVQSISTDGGLSWSGWRVVSRIPGMSPSEPWIIRSPDGKQLLCLLRENARKAGALYMTSDDEGKTWSEAKSTPPGLFGDRHMARYAPDGRLVIAFRDAGPGSPTRNHFVAWVGRYEDITNGRDGEYRIKMLHSYKGGDCGYPGIELLPDKTFVLTTYVKYRPGTEQNSVVSVRFRLDETDRLKAGL